MFSCCTTSDQGLTRLSNKNKRTFSRNSQIVNIDRRQGKLFLLKFKVITIDIVESQSNILIKNINDVKNIIKKHNT